MKRVGTSIPVGSTSGGGGVAEPLTPRAMPAWHRARLFHPRACWCTRTACACACTDESAEPPALPPQLPVSPCGDMKVEWGRMGGTYSEAAGQQRLLAKARLPLGLGHSHMLSCAKRLLCPPCNSYLAWSCAAQVLEWTALVAPEIRHGLCTIVRRVASWQRSKIQGGRDLLQKTAATSVCAVFPCLATSKLSWAGNWYRLVAESASIATGLMTTTSTL